MSPLCKHQKRAAFFRLPTVQLPAQPLFYKRQEPDGGHQLAGNLRLRRWPLVAVPFPKLQSKTGAQTKSSICSGCFECSCSFHGIYGLASYSDTLAAPVLGHYVGSSQLPPSPEWASVDVRPSLTRTPKP